MSSSIEVEPLALSYANLGRPFLGDNKVSGNLASLIQSKFTSSDIDGVTSCIVNIYSYILPANRALFAFWFVWNLKCDLPLNRS